MTEPNNEEELERRSAVRCEVGENSSGMSKGIWIYVEDVLVWGHVYAYDGPLDPYTQGLLNVLWPHKIDRPTYNEPTSIPETTDQVSTTDYSDRVAELVEAAWEMCVEQQAGKSASWSAAKTWAFNNLREKVEPFLVADEDGIRMPPTYVNGTQEPFSE